ncbi:hypothetical protein [Dehalobacterium formicoaceticum]|uniref:hypothetical protein n=1 Tax=Dehalobacterium formicoaceticum TaxID=51515 RepID=UPI000B7E37A9|nr:hypothetical protein [Dehalobacterium formicoaceticum]
MTESSLQQFTLRIQQTLTAPWDFTCLQNYLRLDQVGEATRQALNDDSGIPAKNPLMEAFNLLIEEGQNYRIENIILGINEVFKSYLKNLTSENQDGVTQHFLEFLKMFFIFLTEDCFPYTEKMWEVISTMIKPTGLFLIKESFTTAIPTFFECTALLGKQASRRDLSTGTLQHAFRIAELACRNSGNQEGCTLIQNLRQNLEN